MAAGSSRAASLTLRVAEACVEDIGHAVGRLSPDDLEGMGAQVGDVLKITAAATSVVRADVSDVGKVGLIQIDGTTRSNCGAGLQEQVTVARTEYEQAVEFVSRPCG